MTRKEIGLTVAYALLAAFALGIFHVAAWLGGAFFPVVLVLPIVIASTVRGRPIMTTTLLASIALAAVYVGYAMSLFLSVPIPYKSFALLSVAGMTVYDIPALALALTIVSVTAKTRRRSAASGTRTFSFSAAWLGFAVVTLLGIALAFGIGTRQCGGAGWGYLFVMYIPLIFVWRPALVAIPVLAFVVGGVVPRYVSFDKRVALLLMLLGMLIVGATGFLAATPASEPCSPL
jgi:hypothetical protein